MSVARCDLGCFVLYLSTEVVLVACTLARRGSRHMFIQCHTSYTSYMFVSGDGTVPDPVGAAPSSTSFSASLAFGRKITKRAFYILHVGR